ARRCVRAEGGADPPGGGTLGERFRGDGGVAVALATRTRGSSGVPVAGELDRRRPGRRRGSGRGARLGDPGSASRAGRDVEVARRRSTALARTRAGGGAGPDHGRSHRPIAGGGRGGASGVTRPRVPPPFRGIVDRVS